MKALRRILLIAMGGLITLSVSPAAGARRPDSTVDLVNPLMGTYSSIGLSNGNTVPSVAVPWGMNQWIPQTGKMGHGWSYTYDGEKIRGFKQTHRPSPWINDFGQMSLMPVSGELRTNEDERAAWFSHKTEDARPYYYKVYLADHDVWAEMTPTDRAAMFRFAFPEQDQSWVIVDGFDRGSMIRVEPEKNRVVGYSTRNSGGVADNFRNWFVVEFDRPVAEAVVWDGEGVKKGKTELTGDHSGAAVRFSTKAGEKVGARVATSFISLEQAEQNLKETDGKDFDAVMTDAKKQWEDVLGRVEIESDDLDRLRTFYSCLYRALLFPHKMHEVTADGRTVHWSPSTGEVTDGYLYTGTGFWDTFRALFPLLNLLYPEEAAKMTQGWLNFYRESGFIPEWSSPGHRGCMVGNNSASVAADAILKEQITGKDAEELYEALLAATKAVHPTVSSSGRLGHEWYNKLGYVPSDQGIDESAARTLEYAYDDWAILQAAKKLNRPEKELEELAKRAMNYRNLFDPSVGLMRGRQTDGSWKPDFNPYKWGDVFTEGNSLHYTWSVFQDIAGLIDLMGGPEAFTAKLDSVMVLPPVFDDSYYGGTIHEIREMQIAGMGNYAHGNQPIQHMLYLYPYAGEPWKTQHWVRETMDRLYAATPDGYCGDEDNGQTSAWYIFSALGFYPVIPAGGEYVIGAPLFDRAVLHMPDGKKVEIAAPGASDKRYVGDLKVNGKEHTYGAIGFDTLREGADLNFTMSSEPVKTRGAAASDAPYSFSKERKK